ncbi:DUF1592 domain-containing protein [Pseudenhygromyxa sp. WMMC2535]|uniref:DUF1592 domain-containing protein n=1 Tax=Pseudenhygromyxa sp. WMMC2535 TaxID=2712867 RepID=UPI001553E9ED|nr:DUF1592 domain-containing protein [Pseudenhygromyxa sp. WMMC2535]NVB41080.1 DUF1592 domain-containing protein [Pseudenhygromyxa sp. WMMC2535]
MPRPEQLRRALSAPALTVLVTLAGCSEPADTQGVDAGLYLHRLNATQYANSLEAVLGVESEVARQLPADPPSHGFDNIADVLTTSPLLLELYALATDEAVDAALAPEAAVRVELDSCLAQGDEDRCVAALLERLTTLAWRRPVSADERARLLAIHAEARAAGLPVEAGLAAALRAVLLSPYFLFRVEESAAPGQPTPASDDEIAARLAYFLWSAPPDEALLAAASEGALSTREGVEAQARRMLDDPRAEALADDFAAQWLAFRQLDDVFKDTHRYPDFTQQLRASMAEEPRLLFRYLLTTNADLRELLTSDETYVDAELAALYGIAPPSEPGFTRVSLGDHPRRGLLTQAGLLSVLAYPFTTSPARRGAWVLENLLCQPFGAPPSGVDVPIDADAEGKREELEAHRANPACASCHLSIDPIGLSFEGYDAIGGAIQGEQSEGLDTAGTLPSGVAFADPVELGQRLAEDPRFISCAVQKTMTYALGRGLDDAALAEVEALAGALAARDYGTRELFVLVATSEAFRSRVQETSQ